MENWKFSLSLRESVLPRRLSAAMIILASLFFGFTHWQPALAVDEPNDIAFTVDSGGPDDEQAQSDLTRLGFDISHLGDANPYYGIVISFDDTAYSGANTGDACSFLDGDGDGSADFALCVTIGGNPATLTAASDGSYVKLYDCKDNKPNRCFTTGGGGDGSNGVIGADTDGDGILDTDGNGNSVSLNSNCQLAASGSTLTSDPFSSVPSHGTAQDPTSDTVAVCQFYTDEVAELNGDTFPSVNLTNVCTFPSNQANSDDKDCIVDAGTRFITIVKNVVNSTLDDTFTYAITSSLPENVSASITTASGTGSTEAIAVGEGSGAITYNVSEDADPNWTLASTPTCANDLDPNAPTQNASSLTTGPGERWTCTFTNEPAFVSNPSLLLAKSAITPTYSAVGDLIDYQYTVTNNGNVALAGPVTVTDDKTAVTCPNVNTVGNNDGILDPNESLVCTATYSVVQADLDNDFVLNTATASADGTVSNQAQATANHLSLTLAKSGALDMTVVAPANEANPGDVVNYTLTATNDGNVTLTDVSISDPKLGALSCIGTTTLAPNDSLVCSGSYALTQADIDAGQVDNTAAAISNETPDVPASKTVAVPQVFLLELTKDGQLDQTIAPPTDRADVGDTIQYTLTTTNTGNTTLHAVEITDPKLGALRCTQPVDLAPGESLICTGNYPLTQGDINAGQVENTATAASNETDPTQADKTVSVPQAPNLVLSKEGILDITTVAPDNRADVGDTIRYTLTATNTGNIALSNVSISDPLLGNLTCTPAQPTALAVGASLECVGTYVLTQADIDAGQVENTATAISNETTPTKASKTVSVPRAPNLALQKVGTLDATVVAPADRADVGDEIRYTLVTTNTGNTTLTNVRIDDAMLGTLICAPAAPATLAPGGVLTCAGTHTLAQANIDAGSVANTAVSRSDQTDSTPENVVTPVPQAALLTLTKTGTVDHTVVAPNDRADVGDRIDYALTATNNGNVTLTGVLISDPKLSSLSCTPGQPATLAPGQSLFCTGSHTIAQADIDAGMFENTATASGTAPAGQPVNGGLATVNKPLGQVVDLTLTKETATVNYDTVGEAIQYTLVATNAGNTTLTGAAISDPKVGTLSCTPTQPTTLAPGQTLTCTGSYTVQQSDLDAGQLDNTATASGTGPQDQPANAQASKSVPAVLSPHLSLTKSAAESSYESVNQLLHYTLVALNDGNGTLTGVSISDPKVGTLSCVPAQPATLAPGEALTCTGEYAVTQADLDAGRVDNTATASATDSQSQPVSVLPASASVPANPQPELTLTKDVAESSYGAVGDLLHYTLVATNSGNVTLDNAQIADPLLASLSCTPAQPATLAPGEALTCTGEYSVTQADVDAESVTNAASAEALDPSGQGVDGGPATVTVPATVIPALTLSKSVAEESYSSPGEVLHYTLVVRNTGNVQLDNVAISDPMLADLACTPAQPTVLAPGAVLTCTGSYTTTQADVDAGRVANTATASGSTPQGAPVNAPPDSATVPASQMPHLTLVKQVQENAYSNVGDLLHYTLIATNDGNVTLSNVAISDPQLDSISCTPGQPLTLAPGESYTCTGVHTVTQADLDAGSLQNIASVTGTTPQNGALPPMTDSVTVPANTTAALSLQKTVEETSYDSVGDVLHYTLVARNEGNVTLTEVTISDPLLPGLDCQPAQPATLVPGAALTCTGVYTITAEDLSAGSVQNAAAAQAAAPGGGSVVQAQSMVTVGALHPNLDMQKVATLVDDRFEPAGVSRGDILRYTITIRNLGDGAAVGTVLYDVPDAHTMPVVGSVVTDQGEVVEGNSTGDDRIEVNVGTVPPGGAVTIAFDVQIDPDMPSGVTSIQNQALLSIGNLGGNVNIPSDDPATEATLDPTVTPIVLVPTALEEGEEPLHVAHLVFLPVIQAQ